MALIVTTLIVTTLQPGLSEAKSGVVLSRSTDPGFRFAQSGLQTVGTRGPV